MKMIGPSGKKKPTAVVEVINAYNRPRPPLKMANLVSAIDIAHEVLLSCRVDFDDVVIRSKEIFADSSPYSTHELALHTALVFFKDPFYFKALKDVQTIPRLQVIYWVEIGTIAAPLATAFENVIYELTMLHKDNSTKWEQFVDANRGKHLVDAYWYVHGLITWQHNASYALAMKSEEALKQYKASSDRNKQIERAFLLGICGVAASAFSIDVEQETSFLVQLLGLNGFDRDAAKVEIDAMYRAADEEMHAHYAGCVFFIDFCINGKRKSIALTLAKLQEMCPIKIPTASNLYHIRMRRSNLRIQRV